jgi:hypothetical protein
MLLSSSEVEIFLARLYTDTELLARFVADPSREMLAQNLSNDTVLDMCDMDIQGLIMASISYSHKRQQYQKRKSILVSIYKKLFSLRE